MARTCSQRTPCLRWLAAWPSMRRIMHPCVNFKAQGCLAKCPPQDEADSLLGGANVPAFRVALCAALEAAPGDVEVT